MGLIGDAATNREGYVDARAGIRDLRQQLVPRLIARGDVEPAQLVGALLGVAQRGIDGLTTVAQIHELDALHDAAARDVEAGDDAAAQHQWLPSQARKRRSNWRPASEERSGWNCAPAMEPRATTDAIVA